MFGEQAVMMLQPSPQSDDKDTNVNVEDDHDASLTSANALSNESSFRSRFYYDL